MVKNLKNYTLIAVGSFILAHFAPVCLGMISDFSREQDHIHPQTMVYSPNYFKITVSGASSSYSR